MTHERGQSVICEMLCTRSGTTPDASRPMKVVDNRARDATLNLFKLPFDGTAAVDVICHAMLLPGRGQHRDAGALP